MSVSNISRMAVAALAAGWIAVAGAADFKVTPGSVAGIISGGLPSGDSTLKLTGTIDARDIFALRNLPSDITSLDLSGTSVVSYLSTSSPLEGRLSYPAASIPDFAFFGLSTTTLALPSGVTEIGEGALAGLPVTSLTLPSTLVRVGDYAFHDCQNLETIDLPQSLSSIGKGAFGSCSALKSFDLSATAVRTLPDECFVGCTSLKTVALPSDIDGIGREAFRGSGVENLDLSNVASTSPFALSGMPMLKEVSLRRNAEYAAGLLMGDTGLTSVSQSPLDLPVLFVAGCTALDKKEIVKDAESIDGFAIAGMSAVNIDLGAALTYVGKDAFAGIPSLVSIDASALEDKTPDVEADAFESIDPAKIQLYVTPESVDVWRAHPEWGKMQVTANTGNVTETNLSTPFDVTCSYVDGVLDVKASLMVTTLAVYGIDGTLLAALSPASENVSVRLDAEPGTPVVIRVDASRATKIIKTIL